MANIFQLFLFFFTSLINFGIKCDEASNDKLGFVFLSPSRYAQNHTLNEYTFGFKTKRENTNFCYNCLFEHLIADKTTKLTVSDHYHFEEFLNR